MTIARLLLVLLVLALAGCAAHRPGVELEPALLGAAQPPAGLTPMTDYGAAVLVGFYALGVAALTVGFLVDLVLLPFSAEDPDLFFPCCKEILRLAE